jgi:hypothetical protein
LEYLDPSLALLELFRPIFLGWVSHETLVLMHFLGLLRFVELCLAATQPSSAGSSGGYSDALFRSLWCGYCRGAAVCYSEELYERLEIRPSKAEYCQLDYGVAQEVTRLTCWTFKNSRSLLLSMET